MELISSQAPKPKSEKSFESETGACCHESSDDDFYGVHAWDQTAGNVVRSLKSDLLSLLSCVLASQSMETYITSIERPGSRLLSLLPIQ